MLVAPRAAPGDNSDYRMIRGGADIMKRWALLTVGLYMLILLLLAGPVVCLCFIGNYPSDTAPEVFQVVYGSAFIAMIGKMMGEDGGAPDLWFLILISPWTWALMMGLAQAALLVVPVRFASRKPGTTRWLIWPALAALAMLLVLTGAMLVVAVETAENTPFLDNPTTVIAIACGVGGVWAIWAFLFGFYTIRGGRANFMKRLVRSLIAGSILELLIAVPAHVPARTRNYCCAGFGTFWGIAAGISVMLFAFGPAVFVLFARRYGDLRRRRKAPAAPVPAIPEPINRDAGNKEETN